MFHDRKLVSLKPENVSAEEAGQGIMQLVDFAIWTLHFLIMLEEIGLAQTEYSELRMFAQLDISVCQLMEDNQLAYFVNKVTESHGSVWFMQFQDHQKEVFHFELATSLGTWLVLNREKTM